MDIKKVKGTLEKLGKKYRKADDGFQTKTTSEIQKDKESVKKGYIAKGVGLAFGIMILIALYQFLTKGFHRTVNYKTVQIEDSIQTDGGDPALEILKNQVDTLIKLQEEKETRGNERLKQVELEAKKEMEKLKKEIEEANKKNKELLEQQKVEPTEVDKEEIESLRNELLSEIENIKNMGSKSPIPQYYSEDNVTTNSNIENNALAQSVVKPVKQRNKVVETIEVSDYGIEDILNETDINGTNEETETFDLLIGLSKALMVTGVDAPTFAEGSANPKPVMLSFASPILVANDRSINIRECTGLGSAFGNMNTKRAEITITRINCIVEKGGETYKISEAVQGYVIGEDGSFGLQGRLVDSGSKMVMRQIQIGFLQGTAQAFQAAVQPPVTINSYGSANSEVYNVPSGSSAAGYGAATGVNTGLNALVDYYKAMMDGLYPFISVRGGRTVGVLWQGGEELKVTATKLLDIEQKNTKGTSHKSESSFDREELGYDSW